MNKIRKEIGLTFDDVLIVPRYSEIESRNDVDTRTVLATSSTRLRIPFVASPMDTVTEVAMAKSMIYAGGAAVLHRYVDVATQAGWVAELFKEGLTAIAAIGASEEDKIRFEALYDAGVSGVVIDVANGDSIYSHRMVEWVKNYTDRVFVIAGNVATADAFLGLEKAGADAVRVGIGGGSFCTTRIQAGVGMPQLTAIMDCAEVISVPIIADGGIRTPGDAAKAIAAGADTVMLGGMLVGAKEAPGKIFYDATGPYKWGRGMASRAAQVDRAFKTGASIDANKIVPEGIESKIRCVGSVVDILNELTGGLKSAMSYVGAANVTEFRDCVEFVQITNAGLIESHPHIKMYK